MKSLLKDAPEFVIVEHRIAGGFFEWQLKSFIEWECALVGEEIRGRNECLKHLNNWCKMNGINKYKVDGEEVNIEEND